MVGEQIQNPKSDARQLALSVRVASRREAMAKALRCAIKLRTLVVGVNPKSAIPLSKIV